MKDLLVLASVIVLLESMVYKPTLFGAFLIMILGIYIVVRSELN